MEAGKSDRYDDRDDNVDEDGVLTFRIAHAMVMACVVRPSASNLLSPPLSPASLSLPYFCL